MRAVTLGLLCCVCGVSSTQLAFAQASTASKKPKAAAPAAPAPAAVPSATPPAAAAPAAPEAAPTTAPPAAAPAAVAPNAAPTPSMPAPSGPPPSAPPPGSPPATRPPPPPIYGAPPGEPPPPAYYPPLGGKPEPEVEKGDWDPWEHPTGEQRSHHGFYLRMAIGLGGGSVWGSSHVLPDVKRVSVSGLGFGTSIAVGGSIANNLILNADLFQATLFNPVVRQDGHRIGNASDLDHDVGVGEDVTVAGLGIGLTYYIMPANVYLSGSLGFGQAVFDNTNGDRSGSDFGLAANIMVGKEWWVGSDWGVGVASQLILLTAHDDILGPLGGAIVNVMFSATYN